MTNIAAYREEVNTRCDTCDCTCNIGCGVYDCGNYKWKLWLKNCAEFLIGLLFIGQIVAGGIFFGRDLYTPVHMLDNGTICSVQNDGLTSMNAQKILIATGIIGTLMIGFRMAHFSTFVLHEEYIHTIAAFHILYWIAMATLFALVIYDMAFLFAICSFFGRPLFIIYVLSLIFDVVIIFNLIALHISDMTSINAEDARQYLRGGLPVSTVRRI